MITIKTNPGKTVVVLGNGFDLDLRLKTKYEDFYNSNFCPKNYPAPLIDHLNKPWPNGIDKVRWTDLENELLNYCLKDKHDFITDQEISFLKRFQPCQCILHELSIEDFSLFISLVKKKVICCQDNSGQQMEALHLETLWYNCDEKIDSFKSWVPYRNDVFKTALYRDKEAFHRIKIQLCKYLNSIRDTNRESVSIAGKVLSLLQKNHNRFRESISIYSFNYTKVQMPFPELVEIPVIYMHGSLEDKFVIVGTRNDDKIEKGYEFLAKTNDINYHHPNIEEALNNADEIIFFGHSLGENDHQYFADFFKGQANCNILDRKPITFFTRDSNSENCIIESLQRMTDNNHYPLKKRIIKTGELDEDGLDLVDFLTEHGCTKMNAVNFLSIIKAQQRGL